MSAANVTRCDRCTRPATHKVQTKNPASDGATGVFCGRHAAKSRLPCVGLTREAAGFGARRVNLTTAPKETNEQ